MVPAQFAPVVHPQDAVLILETAHVFKVKGLFPFVDGAGL